MLNHLYALSIKVSAGPARLLGEGMGAALTPGTCSTCREQNLVSRGVEMGPGCLVKCGTKRGGGCGFLTIPFSCLPAP